MEISNLDITISKSGAITPQKWKDGASFLLGCYRGYIGLIIFHANESADPAIHGRFCQFYHFLALKINLHDAHYFNLATIKIFYKILWVSMHMQSFDCVTFVFGPKFSKKLQNLAIFSKFWCFQPCFDPNTKVTQSNDCMCMDTHKILKKIFIVVKFQWCASRNLIFSAKKW